MPSCVLFVNEGQLGGGVLGHAGLELLLSEAFAKYDDVEATFRGLGAMGRIGRTAVRGLPGLHQMDLDLQPTRWHVVQSIRARRLVGEARREHAVEALHVHTHTSALLLARHMRQVPTFLSVDSTATDWHAMGIWQRPRSWSLPSLAATRALERRAFRGAEAVLAWTDWTRRGVEQVADDANIVTLHPGIDLERFRPAPRLPRDRPRLLFVGGRFREKGGDLLLDVLGDRLGRDLDLDVVTTAPLDPRPGMAVHRLGPGDPSLVELYQQADLFCLPTVGDAVPFSVLEAMATAVPVISTDVGSIPELLGGTGIVVPRRDGRALAEALGALLDDETRSAELGRAARARAEVSYDAHHQSAKLVKLLLTT